MRNILFASFLFAIVVIFVGAFIQWNSETAAFALRLANIEEKERDIKKQQEETKKQLHDFSELLMSVVLTVQMVTKPMLMKCYALLTLLECIAWP